MFNRSHLHIMSNLACDGYNHDDKYEMNGEYWEEQNFNLLVELNILVLVYRKPTGFHGITKAIYQFHPKFTREQADVVLNLMYEHEFWLL